MNKDRRVGVGCVLQRALGSTVPLARSITQTRGRWAGGLFSQTDCVGLKRRHKEEEALSLSLAHSLACPLCLDPPSFAPSVSRSQLEDVSAVCLQDLFSAALRSDLNFSLNECACLYDKGSKGTPV